MKIFPVLLAVMLSTIPTPSLVAQDLPVGAADARPLPQVQTQNGARYMCGGIGLNEVARLKQLAPEYELMLSFSAANGAYLADIKVEISKDSGEKLVAALCDGPIMLIDVPQADTYLITAETEGHKVTRTARVSDGQKGKRLSMTWPTRLVDSPSTALR